MIVDDLDVLLAFDDFPAEHWIRLRTTNPIEPSFPAARGNRVAALRPRYDQLRSLAVQAASAETTT